MPFGNEVVGGTTLVRPAIRSANYVPGVSGWSINRDGSVEFATGTFRGPVIIIDPVTGDVLASIGATGNGAFQNLSVIGDILLGDVSLLDFIVGGAQGLMSQVRLSGALPTPGLAVYANTAWIEWQASAGRLYRIKTTPFEIRDTVLGTRQLFARLALTSPNSGFAGTVYENGVDVESTAETMVAEAVFAATATAVQRAQLACQASSTSTGMTLPNPANSFALTVEDIGSALLSSIGGSGTAAGASQFTTRYTCTASRTYDGSGNFIGSPDGDNNLYSGDFASRAFGFESGIWIFPGATIRTDLSGATVQSARLWMFCHTCDDTGGDIQYSWRTNTTIPATDPGVGANEIGFNNIFPIPGWGSIDLIAGGQLTTNIITGSANAVRIRNNVIAQDATGWRGFGFGASTRPYIEITYTK